MMALSSSGGKLDDDMTYPSKDQTQESVVEIIAVIRERAIYVPLVMNVVVKLEGVHAQREELCEWGSFMT
jgi:hypothetical protein